MMLSPQCQLDLMARTDATRHHDRRTTGLFNYVAWDQAVSRIRFGASSNVDAII
jgi:hypothetical protein